MFVPTGSFTKTAFRCWEGGEQGGTALSNKCAGNPMWSPALLHHSAAEAFELNELRCVHFQDRL